MSFSQGWDTGFKSLLIYIGIVFGWLIFVEPHMPNIGTSVVIMNIVAVAAGAGFFLRRRRACINERQSAEAHVAAILAED